MSGYLVTVITAAFFCSLINSLLTEKGAGKTAKSIVAIVMVMVTVLPILKFIVSFSKEISLPVINDYESHIIDSEDEDIRLYRKWLAETTAKELEKEIESSLKSGTGLTVRAECPWSFNGNDVVFDVVKLYTDADERYYKKIENYVKLHFSLESKCQKEVK